ncbi:MAG: nucleoside-diphosphate-sugar epimerase [Myxococcota bacterium]|jgi:nucleoside-diphosphate-sugar epimerase
MKVLITGHRGYIGCHAVDVFQRAAHQVTGVDIGYFDDCSFEQRTLANVEITADVANLTLEQISGHDVIIHLAAISNDPMGELDERLTMHTNVDATLHLAKLAKQAGVSRFVFASSCAVYGDSQGVAADENHAVAPQTAYARSKIIAEQALLEMDADGFTVCILRNATAYGHSPALRTDLVFNDFVAGLAINNCVHLLSDGEACRPLVHCRDIAYAFLNVAEADLMSIAGEIFNVGNAEQNIKVVDLARLVCAAQPDSELSFSTQASPDQRDYWVDFTKISAKVPNFATRYSLSTEANYLLNSCLQQQDFADKQLKGRFSRLRQIKKQLD